MKKSVKIQRVVVAMSGGVDSSVAAMLLKEKGLDVVGMAMQVFDHSSCDTDRWGSCCSPDDIHDARAVAAYLKIPFYVINLEDKFKAEIIDKFADEYSRAKTPNPCIICNSRFKFYHLMLRAKAIEADFVATGHYARIKENGGRFALLKGKDDKKDQSYFLYSVTREQLSKIIFPLGGLCKAEVRKIARESGLKTHEKKESQEICFVSEGKYGDFLEASYRHKLKGEGDFVDQQGNPVGKHKGIHRYTIGQRRGLNVSFGKPRYVTKIDAEKNTVVLGESKDLLRSEFIVGEVTWINEPKEKSLRVSTKVRYQTPEAPSKIEIVGNGMVKVMFFEPQKSITPGQAAVFYIGDEVIGGGWIQ